MTQYVLMNTKSGIIYKNQVRNEAPTLIEKGDYRWLTIYEGTLAGPWERFTTLPESVALGATTITLNRESQTLTAWKAKRAADIRNEQWSRVAAVYHIGQIINYYAIAIRLVNKKASGQALTAPETTLLANIGAGVANNIEPISSAADDAVSAINNAATHAAVETAFAGVQWPT